ncbi:MAG: elongation factor P-like protein YeiP [Desulfobacteraceae bacterium]
MPKACNLKKSQVININDQPYQIKQIEVQTPSARGANTLYKIRMRGIINGQNHHETYKGNDQVEEMVVERRVCSYLYRHQDMFTFMDSETYEQYTISEQNIEDQVQWLADEMTGITTLLLDGVIVGIELPVTVELEVADTAPAIKGATATNRNKPAILSNGVTVMVPEYLSTGEMVKVNTETGKYMSRVKG